MCKLRTLQLRGVPRHRRTPLATGVMGAALAVAVVVGIAQGQLGPQRRAGGGTGVARPAQARAGAPSGAVSTGSTSAAAGTVTRTSGAITVYLASTPDEERTLRAWLAQGRFGMPGGAPTNATVILAPSEAEAGIASAAVLESLNNSGIGAGLLDGRTIQRR